MGGFAAAIPMAMQAVGAVAGMAAQDQQAKAAAKAAGDQQNLQYQMMWEQQEQRVKQQRDLLKRQLATSRAALAGGGIGFAGGSGQALMQGMTQKAEEDIVDGYDMIGLQQRARFNTGDTKSSTAEKLMQGLDKTKQVYSIFRPFSN